MNFEIVDNIIDIDKNKEYDYVIICNGYTLTDDCQEKMVSYFNEYTGMVYSNGLIINKGIKYYIYNEPYSRARVKNNVVCGPIMVSREALIYSNFKPSIEKITERFVARHIPEILWQLIDLQ